MLITDNNNFDYNLDAHRYILTTNGTLNLRGIDVSAKFQDEGEANAFLNKVSYDIYQYAYSLSTNFGDIYTKRSSVLEYLIYLNENGEVDAIIDAMLDQVTYALQSGGNVFANEFEHNGQLLTDTQRRELRISPDAKTRLQQTILGRKSQVQFRVPSELYRGEY